MYINRDFFRKISAFRIAAPRAEGGKRGGGAGGGGEKNTEAKKSGKKKPQIRRWRIQFRPCEHAPPDLLSAPPDAAALAMPAEPVVGQVVGRRQWTPTLFSLQAEADIQPFAAGQFGRVGLEIDGEKIFRPYSFVNPPSSRPLEFVYIVVPEGPLSVRLSELREGDPILMQPKPNGFLVMEEVPDSKQLWMLSTGTAVGPFISILREGQAQKRFAKIILAHAVRLADELVYAEDAREMAAASGGQIQYIPFVSREKTDFAMGGRITDAIQSGELQKRAGMEIAPETTQFMLCGNPQMVKDTSEILRERGFERNRRRAPGHITVENYW